MPRPVHPLAEIFPPLDPGELRSLAESMRRHGFLESHPIVLHDGAILDGRNRDAAAELAGVEAIYRDWDGECGSPLQYVIACNLERRQLTTSQRALVAARLVPLLQQERANLPAGRARDQAARALGVSGRSVSSGQRVAERGSRQLQDAVASGEIAISRAAEIANLPAEEQARRLNASERRAAKAGVKRQRAELLERLAKRLRLCRADAEALELVAVVRHLDRAAAALAG